MPAVTGAASRIQGNQSWGLTSDQTDTGYRAKRSKTSLAPPPFTIWLLRRRLFGLYAEPGLHRLRDLFSIDNFPVHPNPPRRPLSGPR